jgi:hypothetical protein
MTLMALCDIACQNTKAKVQPAKCYWPNIALSKLGAILSATCALDCPEVSSYEVFKQNLYKISLYLNI